MERPDGHGTQGGRGRSGDIGAALSAPWTIASQAPLAMATLFLPLVLGLLLTMGGGSIKPTLVPGPVTVTTAPAAPGSSPDGSSAGGADGSVGGPVGGPVPSPADGTTWSVPAGAGEGSARGLLRLLGALAYGALVSALLAAALGRSKTPDRSDVQGTFFLRWACAAVSVIPAAGAVWLVISRTGLVILAAVAVIVVLILRGRPRAPQRRGARSHVTADGTPKISYATEAEAEQAASESAARYGEDMNAYRCASCPGWHVGHRRPAP